MSDAYKVGSGLSEAEFKLSSWWVRHQIHLRRLGFGTLAILTAVLWGYTVWSVIDAYVISYPRESQISRLIAQNELAQGSLASTTPQPVQASSVLLFSGTDARQDFLVQISNPNPQWWAEFTYHFKAGNEDTPEREGYILPSGQRYLSEGGWKGKEGAASAAELQISRLRWHRVDPLKVGRDYPAFAADRLRFQIEEPKYSNDLAINNQTVGQSSFTLRNGSGYGFWSVDVTVILTRAGTPIGATTLNVRNLKPGEARPITINWFENLSGVTKTDVYTDVNILDPSAFLPSQQF